MNKCDKDGWFETEECGYEPGALYRFKDSHENETFMVLRTESSDPGGTFLVHILKHNGILGWFRTAFSRGNCLPSGVEKHT